MDVLFSSLPYFLALSVVIVVATTLASYIVLRQAKSLSEKTLQTQVQQLKDSLFHTLITNQQQLNDSLTHFSKEWTSQEKENSTQLHTLLRQNFLDTDKQVNNILLRTTNQLTAQFEQLNQTLNNQLTRITESVDVKLSKGFEKTNETFTNIIKRLAIIDDAQKKITDLSENVVSLQEILSDKSARGAFGEVQLKTLVQNALPSNSYRLQHTLSNGMRCDCILMLPEPTGNIVVDAKFPLENYKRFADIEANEKQKVSAKQQFKIDIKKHIQAISQKYILPGETNDAALLFIPAEAIFAEIHAHHPDLVEHANQARVWLASPSTMLAILTTCCAVLKDSATRQQVHIIQDHLRLLAQDFNRFEKRMDNLSRHIQQASSDVEQIHTSSQKITKRFYQIEKVELNEELLGSEEKNVIE